MIFSSPVTSATAASSRSPGSGGCGKLAGPALQAEWRARREAALAASKEILLVMGEYFQVQDDFLDCYGSPEVIGKIGTDIQDNKCGWLVVQAMARCSAAQLALLKADYGRHDDAAVARRAAAERREEEERSEGE